MTKDRYKEGAEIAVSDKGIIVKPKMPSSPPWSNYKAIEQNFKSHQIKNER